MIPPNQFVEYVIRPTLKHLAVVEPRFDNLASEQLLLGTALMESRLDALRQRGGGPALSVFQIEPMTHDDTYNRYLRTKPLFLGQVNDLLIPALTPLEQLAGNPFFACAIARIKYWMVPEPLPSAGDLEALGRYWKQYYNTAGGDGNAVMFADLYRKYVKP